MKIETHHPPLETPPPPVFTMHFNRDDGRVIAAALREYALNHRQGEHRLKCISWAVDLEKELETVEPRRGPRTHYGVICASCGAGYDVGYDSCPGCGSRATRSEEEVA